MKYYALFLLLLLGVFIYMAQTLDAPPDKRFITGGEDSLAISVQVCIEKTDLRTSRGCKCSRKVPEACALEFEARVLRAKTVAMPRSVCAAVAVDKLRRVLVHAMQYRKRAQEERMLRRRIREYCLPRCFCK